MLHLNIHKVIYVLFSVMAAAGARRNSLKSWIPFSHFSRSLHPISKTEVSHEGKPDECLRLNIGGTGYRLNVSTINSAGGEPGILHTFANVSHEKRITLCDEYMERSKEYFFEKTAALFEPIYQYYTTGYCYKPCCIPEDIFKQELITWGVLKAFYPDTTIFDRNFFTENDEFKDIWFGEIRRKIWNLFEEPQTSITARIVATISIVAILISNLGLVLGSMEEFQIPVENADFNCTINCLTELHPILRYMETILITLFTMEFTIRFLVIPRKKDFFLNFFNLMDFIAITPFFIALLSDVIGVGDAQLNLLFVLRISRVVRIFRLITLARYSTGLRLFLAVVKRSVSQLGIVFGAIGIGVMFFSTFIYYVEKDIEGTKFDSIPASFWWCIVTITTVGYGDMYPESAAGKLVAVLAIVCSVLLLCLPVTVIAESYMEVQLEFNEKSMAQNIVQSLDVARSRKKSFFDR